MKIEWANNAEPVETDVNGEKKLIYTATIDLEDGQAVQKFEGESHKEVADKLMVAQGNATARIRQLKKETPETPAKPPIEFKKRSLSADEQFEVAQDLGDAAKAGDAIKRVVEAELGAPLEDIREDMQERQNKEFAAQARKAAADFIAETPDYKLCQHNEDVMIKYGELHNLPANDIASYRKIWIALKEAALVIVKADTDEDEVETSQPGAQANGGLPNAPVTRSRLASSSTSLRRGDSDDAPGRLEKPKYTRAEIEAMPSALYNEKFKSEPGFAKFVDGLK